LNWSSERRSRIVLLAADSRLAEVFHFPSVINSFRSYT
jgi:hypothetical protein